MNQENNVEPISFFSRHKKGIIILGIGLGLMLVLLMILTQCPSIIGFSNNGSIGDTIEGIIAPISGLLGAFLVYVAFIEQVKANDIQNRRYEEDQKKARLNGYIDNIKRDIDLNGHPKELIKDIRDSYIQIIEPVTSGKSYDIENLVRDLYNKNELSIHRVNYVFENALNLYFEIKGTNEDVIYMPVLRYHLSLYIESDILSNLSLRLLIFHKTMKEKYQKELDDSDSVVFSIIYPILKSFIVNIQKMELLYCLNMKLKSNKIDI